MKNMQQKTPNHNTAFNAKKQRPENKDNLDSREGEEQTWKGDDTTHNKREKHSEKKGTKK